MAGFLTHQFSVFTLAAGVALGAAPSVGAAPASAPTHAASAPDGDDAPLRTRNRDKFGSSAVTGGLTQDDAGYRKLGEGIEDRNVQGLKDKIDARLAAGDAARANGDAARAAKAKHMEELHDRMAGRKAHRAEKTAARRARTACLNRVFETATSGEQLTSDALEKACPRVPSVPLAGPGGR
jgi:hypothetical protein